MEIRVTIRSGQTRVETISILEDLWHDFEFFKAESLRHDQVDAPVSERLIAKRHQRAALLTLFCYLEGVANRWFKKLFSDAEWRVAERRWSLERKIAKIQARSATPEGPIAITETKKIRNALVHLKPGNDLDLYDRVNADLLEKIERDVLRWLGAMEQALSIPRHPDTQAESKALRDALGTPIAEGYSGRSKE